MDAAETTMSGSAFQRRQPESLGYR